MSRFVVKFRYPDTGKVGLALSDVFYEEGTKLVVRTDRGEELIKVLKTYPFDEDALKASGVDPGLLYRVVRIAGKEDEERFRENVSFSKDALKVCEEKVKKHNLPMKLVSAYATLGRERIVFYFTAESRVDFRQLVRDLASHFRTRIELRQIGVRDEVKMLGGIGMCGRVCCCVEFLECFESISLNLAKLQGLPLNPAKLSGACGRLLCCLKFEERTYDIARFLPAVDEEIETPEGKGRVVSVDIPRGTIHVEIDGVRRRFPIERFVEKDVWEDYIRKLGEFPDDRFKCFTRAGVIGGDTGSDLKESSE